uniref:Uncharacterized protein n=1 Tax=Lepeophtheirus salmonis TaxID=72036 RepID=A0A0K2UVD5_LEPSM
MSFFILFQVLPQVKNILFHKSEGFHEGNMEILPFL